MVRDLAIGKVWGRTKVPSGKITSSTFAMATFFKNALISEAALTIW